jgi:nucleotide-binding universal stress UspA family protein
MKRKILCAADFQEASRWAVTHAAELARTNGAELLLCHFIDSPYRYAREVVYAEPGSDTEVLMGPEVRRGYEERLRAYCGDRLEGRVRLVVGDGAPEVEILRLARREKADLIVLGQGSGTAPQVLSRARCPVVMATGPHKFVITGAEAEPHRQAAAA